MNRHRELFHKYISGGLGESAADELHELLVKAYFQAPGTLDSGEREYAEDLVIQLYSTGKLDANYGGLFKEAIMANTVLSGKYQVLRSLAEPSLTSKNKSSILLASSENPAAEEQEEEELSALLQEAIRKVHAESETGKLYTVVQNLSGKLVSFFKLWVPAGGIWQPGFRTVLVFASVLLLALFVWILGPRQNSNLLSILGNPDSIRKNQPVVIPGKEKDTINDKSTRPGSTDTGSSINTLKHKKQPEKSRLKSVPADGSLIKAEPLLLAYAGEIPASLDYTELRSETSDATDLFIEAAEKYNRKEYDSCILIMSGLIARKDFRSPDTLNELNFYLGIMNMSKGFDKPDRKFLKHALQSFSRVDQSSDYFVDSQWYSALTLLRLGNRSAGLDKLNSLITKGSKRSEEAGLLKTRISE